LSAPQILTQHLFDKNIGKHEVTLQIIMQNMSFFYSPLLIQIYWIMYILHCVTNTCVRSQQQRTDDIMCLITGAEKKFVENFGSIAM
jgi:hypothetical protein